MPQISIYSAIYQRGVEWEVGLVRADSHYNAERIAAENTPVGYRVYGVFWLYSEDNKDWTYKTVTSV